MISMANPYEKYRQQNVLMANPMDLVVMLYDGCIKNLKLAIMDLEEEKAGEANHHLQMAQDIIMELIMSLDFNYEISDDLLNLYEFMLKQLIQANMEKQTQPIADVIELMESLREAWVEVQKTNKVPVVALED